MAVSRGGKRQRSRCRSACDLCLVDRCCLPPLKSSLFVTAWLIWVAGVSSRYAGEVPRQEAPEGLDPARPCIQTPRCEAARRAPVISSVANEQAEDHAAARELEDPAIAAQPAGKGKTIGTEVVEEDEEPASKRFKEYEALKKMTPALDRVLDLPGLQEGCAVAALSLMLYHARRIVPAVLGVGKGLKALQMFTSAVVVLRFSEYLISLWKRNKYRHRLWEAHQKIAFGRGNREERRKELVALHKSIKRAGVVRLNGVEPLIFMLGGAVTFWGSLYRAASYPFLAYIPFVMLGIAQNWSDRRAALARAEEEEDLLSADSETNAATQKDSAERNEQLKHVNNLKNRGQKPGR